MEREVKLILGGIGAIALLLAGIIVVLAVDFDDQEIEVKEEEIIPEEEVPEKIGTRVHIYSVYFTNSEQYTRSNRTRQIMDVTVYLSNTGDETSRNVTMIAHAVNQKTNMGEDKQKVFVYDIPPMKTAEANIELDMPSDKEYRIDIIVFEDGLITKQGYGTVKIESQMGGYAQGFQTTYSDRDGDGIPDDKEYDDDDENDDTGPGYYSNNEPISPPERNEGKFISEKEANSFYGILITLVLVVIVVVVILVIWLRKRRKISAKDSGTPDVKRLIHQTQGTGNEGFEDPTCRECGANIKYIFDHRKWWCDNCNEYVRAPRSSNSKKLAIGKNSINRIPDAEGLEEYGK